MDLETNGTISKLSMYALCDTTIAKEQAYVLCDSVWEILTGGSRSMESREFINKLKQSEIMRRIFFKLLQLQTMREGEDNYGVPVSNRDVVVEEIRQITKEWCKRKANGRFFALDSMLPSFKEAVDKKNETLMWKIFHEASRFQAKRRGQEAVKVGHYVKVMMGLLEAKNWDFAIKEHARVKALLLGDGASALSEGQLQRFTHLLSVLEAFRNPCEETAWVKATDLKSDLEHDVLSNSQSNRIVRRKGDTLLGSAMGNVVG